MTWKEIKLATLQKMFAADGNTLVVDESTKDYIAGMPQACNEGLQLLSTAGKFIVKSFSIANNPIDNMIPDSEAQKITQMIRGTKQYSAENGQSYCFECLGKGNVKVYRGDTVIAVLDIDNKQSFREYKGLIDNKNGLSVKLEFTSDYPMQIKNIAIYDADFESEDDIPTYSAKIKYNVDDIVDDFYELDSSEVYFEGEEPRYINTDEFFREGNKLFVVDRDLKGNFTIYYKAYPPTITTATLDEYELPIDREVAVLLPLYMASQLYKDDDTDIANGYRNDFEVGFNALTNKSQSPTAEQFTSESGWI